MTTEKQNIQKKEKQDVDAVERARAGKVFTPAVDIFEQGDEIVLYADMPGVDPNSIDITVEKDILSIRGEIGEKAPKDYDLIYSEYETGDFARTFTLGDQIDQNKIKASYDDGVLKVCLAKAEKAKPKKIDVKFG